MHFTCLALHLPTGLPIDALEVGLRLPRGGCLPYLPKLWGLLRPLGRVHFPALANDLQLAVHMRHMRMSAPRPRGGPRSCGPSLGPDRKPHGGGSSVLGISRVGSDIRIGSWPGGQLVTAAALLEVVQALAHVGQRVLGLLEVF